MVVDLLGFPANLLTEELESLRFPVDRLYFPPNRPDKLDIRLLICWVVGAFFHGAISLAGVVRGQFNDKPEKKKSSSMPRVQSHSRSTELLGSLQIRIS
jgi:hypothetical protein